MEHMLSAKEVVWDEKTKRQISIV